MERDTETAVIAGVDKTAKTAVTVLMPVYNAERYLRESISSVLDQTHKEFEFLIINDGSTDNTREIVSSFADSRIHYHENDQNMGMVATLNRGLELASNELIARQDGDDLCAPERLERQVDFMNAHLQTPLTGALSSVIDQDGDEVYAGVLEKPLEPLGVRWFQMFDNPFVHTSVMFRKKVVVGEFGGYRWSDCCSDFDLWTRVATVYPTMNLPQRLVKHRVHSDSIIGSMFGDDKEKLKLSDKERTAIIRRNVVNTVGDILTDEQINLLARFVHGLKADEAGPFLSASEKLMEKYINKYPEASGSSEFRYTVASQYAMVAYWLLPQDRVKALMVYKKGIAYSAKLIWNLPWGRMVALALFGEPVRSAFAKARRMIRPKAKG